MAQTRSQIPSDPRELLAVAWRRRWIILVPFVLLGGAGTFLAKTLPSVYRSSTVILVEKPKVPETYVRSTVTTQIEDRLSTITQQILSRTRLEAIIKQYDLYAEERATEPMEAVVERMRRAIEVQVRGNDAFTIYYRGRDPQAVRDVTNELAAVFIEANSKVREDQATGTAEFLQSQLESLKEVLSEQESRVREFKQRHIGELPQQQEANLRSLDRLQMQAQTIGDQLRAAEDRRLALQTQIAATPRFNRILNPVRRGSGQPESAPVTPHVAAALPLAPEREDPLVRRLEEARATLGTLQGRYTEAHPDVIRARRQVEEIEKRLRESQTGQKSNVALLPPAAAPPAAGDAPRVRWDRRLVDPQSDVVGDVAMRIDAAGSLHLAYTNGPRAQVRYATGGRVASDSNGLNIETVGPGGGTVALAVDRRGRPHIVFRSSATAMHTASRVGGRWQVATVRVPGVWEYQTAAAVDASDVLAFTAYQRCGVGPTFCGAGEGAYVAQLYLITQEGRAAQILDPPGGQAGSGNPEFGKWNAVVGDPHAAGRLHVAYQVIDSSRGVQAVRYALWDGARVAAMETVESAGLGPLGRAVKIALDSQGNPHVAYIGPGGGVRHAWRDGQRWHRAVVDGTSTRGESLAFALDTGDRAHLAYFDRAGSRIIYARSQPPMSDSWSFEEAATHVTQRPDSAEQFIDIGMHGGEPIIAYHAVVKAPGTSAARTLVLASRALAARPREPLVASVEPTEPEEQQVPNPIYDQLAAQLAATDEEIRTLRESQRQVMHQVRETQLKVENVPRLEQQLMEITRDYDNTRRTYDSLLSKKLEAQLAENLEKRQKGEQFRVLDPAILPQRPYRPQRPLILAFGLALGLGVGIAGVVGIETLDHSVRGTRDLQTLVPRVQLFGTVPLIRNRRTVFKRRLALTGAAVLILSLLVTAVLLALQYKEQIARLRPLDLLLR